MNQNETKKLCATERRKVASSYGVMLFIVLALTFSWMNIWASSRNVVKEKAEQTAIAGAFAKAGTAMVVLGEKSEILYWDQNSVKLFGFTQTEVMEKGIDVVVPYGGGHNEHVKKSIEENDPRLKIITCEAVTKEGSIVPVVLRVYSPFQENKILILADEFKSDTLTKR